MMMKRGRLVSNLGRGSREGTLHGQGMRREQQQDTTDAGSTSHHHHHNHNHHHGGGTDRAAAAAAATASSPSSSSPYSKDCQGVVRRETRAVNVLRAAVMVLLVCVGILVCLGVFLYTKNDEKQTFEMAYEANAHQIIESFHDAVERRLGAIHSMSTAITSYALDTNKTFPFVTVPNFAVRGSDLRIQADAIAVHYLPVITDDTREAWEEYALENRFQVDEAWEEDSTLRQQQDEYFGMTSSSKNNNRHQRILQAAAAAAANTNTSLLTDGTGFHPRIWSNGAVLPEGDRETGTGPYLPVWQRSPISGVRQKMLNLDFGQARSLHGILEPLQESQEAVMNRAVIPTPYGKEIIQANLRVGQFRHNIDDVVDDPITFIGYPVFDSFQPKNNRSLVGVVATNIYWKLFFERILLPQASSVFCILENSFNQTLAFRVDGPHATFLGEGYPEEILRDAHDSDGPDEFFADINARVSDRAGPQSRSYTEVPLNQDFGKYTLRIYPANNVEYSNNPWVYALVVACSFLFTSIVFCLFSFFVERRQRIIMNTAIANAERVATTERQLNSFLAHEIRNPLCAALTACSFVNSAITNDRTGDDNNSDENEPPPPALESFRISLQEDVKIIKSSLTFIDDFLRGMLDLHHAVLNQIELKLSPTDLLKDVLEPVANMLIQHDSAVTVSVDCPENLIILTDSLRLKQVMHNLGRNSIQFVSAGFVRLRAQVVKDGLVELSVEDSGPGIPADKRGELFEKFQASLEVLDQGTGIGLCLCKNLMILMKGDISLDETYDSGYQNFPGARFVVQLNRPPLYPLKEMSSTTGCSNKTDDSIMNSFKADDGTEPETQGTGSDIEHEAGGTSIDIMEPPRIETCDLHPVDGIKASTEQPKEISVDASCTGSDVDPTTRDEILTQQPKNSSQDQDESHGRANEEDELELPTDLSILFVDDDKILRRLFSRAIKRVAPTWTVEQAVSGEDALQMAERAEFDLIFMDQYMPPGSGATPDQKQLLGTDTVRALRSRGVTSRICGLSANELEDSFIDAGADSFMLKPIPGSANDLKRQLHFILWGNSMVVESGSRKGLSV